jgi:hypothetical protein
MLRLETNYSSVIYVLDFFKATFCILAHAQSDILVLLFCITRKAWKGGGDCDKVLVLYSLNCGVPGSFFFFF